MTAAFFAHKPANLAEVEAAAGDEDSKLKYCIAARVTLTPAQYDAWTANLYADKSAYIGENQGGTRNGLVQATEVRAKGRKTLLVDCSGYGYARYVAVK